MASAILLCMAQICALAEALPRRIRRASAEPYESDAAEVLPHEVASSLVMQCTHLPSVGECDAADEAEDAHDMESSASSA